MIPVVRFYKQFLSPVQLIPAHEIELSALGSTQLRHDLKTATLSSGHGEGCFF
jgi:hypothetical protein